MLTVARAPDGLRFLNPSGDEGVQTGRVGGGLIHLRSIAGMSLPSDGLMP
jgi:hypothetical protein